MPKETKIKIVTDRDKLKGARLKEFKSVEVLFKSEYPNYTIEFRDSLHDRYLINEANAYSLGGSIKDAAKKSDYSIIQLTDEKRAELFALYTQPGKFSRRQKAAWLIRGVRSNKGNPCTKNTQHLYSQKMKTLKFGDTWTSRNFTQLVSLIDSRRLYFTRADKFEDPFEGSWPKINVEAREYVPEDIPPEGREKFLKTMRSMGEINKHWPMYQAINCWHMNDYESAAMWKLYLKSDEGIAIQSTYSKLKKSLIDDEKIFLRGVNYIDYDTESIDCKNILSAFVHKRKSFSHEHEVRALISKWPTGEEDMDFSQDTIEHGLHIRVDIETLIERIFIAPNAPAWFTDLVTAVITRYGYNFEVVHSKLNENPVF